MSALEQLHVRVTTAARPGAAYWLQRPAVSAVMALALLVMTTWVLQAAAQGDFAWAAAWCILPLAVVAYLVFSTLRARVVDLVHRWLRRPCRPGSLMSLVATISPSPQRFFALARARETIP
jgi:hypothetical protein